MGYLRTKSESRLKLALNERDTLLPCQACKGNGRIVIETATSYRALQCRWCNGAGVIAKDVLQAYLRIKRIYAYNYRKGNCKG